MTPTAGAARRGRGRQERAPRLCGARHASGCAIARAAPISGRPRRRAAGTGAHGRDEFVKRRALVLPPEQLPSGIGRSMWPPAEARAGRAAGQPRHPRASFGAADHAAASEGFCALVSAPTPGRGARRTAGGAGSCRAGAGQSRDLRVGGCDPDARVDQRDRGGLAPYRTRWARNSARASPSLRFPWPRVSSVAARKTLSGAPDPSQLGVDRGAAGLTTPACFA